MAFSLDISHPLPNGFTQGIGAPFVGTHAPADHWYIHYGNDLGAPPGTDVVAPFDLHLTKVVPHDPAADTAKVYGAQLFMRAPNDMMGAFFTHLTDLSPEVVAGASIARGQRLGGVYERPGTGSHLHLALVEILGGVPAGGAAPESNYHGFSLYEQFTQMPLDSTLSVTFAQDGSSPTVAGGSSGSEPVGGVVDFGSLAGIQTALAALGFDPGTIDGLDGPRTRAAVAAYQLDVLQVDPPSGTVDDATRTALATGLRNLGYDVVND